MPRPSRLELAGVPVHVIQRGVNGMPCFFTDVDRRFYLKCLAKYAGRRQCAIHAYVLMTNHVHLLLTPTRAGNVARMMQDVGRVYVRTINLLHGRTGTLWDGRFKSSLIDSETYLLYCHRYIEMNPVRAGMVGHSKDYPWSSHEHYAIGRSNPLITEHALYRELNSHEARRREAFAALFSTALPRDVVDRIRAAANANAALGSQEFLARASALAGRDVKVPNRGRPRREVAAPEKTGVIDKLL
jgi:putative transposase